MYNLNEDPRVVTDHQRVVRNVRYIRRIMRDGAVSDGSVRGIDVILEAEVPLSSDRSFLKRIMRSSGFDGVRHLNRQEFGREIAAFKIDDIGRLDTHLSSILRREVSPTVEEAAPVVQPLPKPAVVSVVTSAPLPPPRAPVKTVTLPRLLRTAPRNEQGMEPPKARGPSRWRAPVLEAVRPPEPVAPALVDTGSRQGSFKEVRKRARVLAAPRVAAYLGLRLMVKVLREEYGWPFENRLPYTFVWPVMSKVWSSGKSPPSQHVTTLRDDRVIRACGKFEVRGTLWQVLDVEVEAREGSGPVILLSVSEIRTLIAEVCPSGIELLVQTVVRWNSDLILMVPSIARALRSGEPAPTGPKTPGEMFAELSADEKLAFAADVVRGLSSHERWAFLVRNFPGDIEILVERQLQLRSRT